MTSHRTYGMDFDRNLHHGELGLSDAQVIEMYRLMLTTRRIDDRLFALQRQGRAPFVVGSSGHEAIQVASGLALDRDRDWVLPYYRDMGVALAWGFTPEEIFLGAFAKKTDPMSGGRQLPGHWSSRERRVLTQSSVIGTQYPHAVGIAQAVANRGDDAVVAVYGGEGTVMEVANGPGEPILAGELAKGLEILASGGDIDYVGASDVELIGPGEAAGSFREVEIEGGKIETVKYR